MELNKEIGMRIKQCREDSQMTLESLANSVWLTKSTIKRYETGEIKNIKKPVLHAIAKTLNVDPNYLFLKTDEKGFFTERYDEYTPPTITEDTVQIPIIGEIAARYDKIAIEEWSTEQVEIPTSFLNGRERNEYFFLVVKGDSMYPDYKDGDKVLILRQPTLDYSGQVGAIIYEDCATLKRIEFVPGEDWLRMVPINPQFPPKRVEGVDLEQCKIVGIPKMLIREI